MAGVVVAFAVLHDVAVGVAVSVARRHDGRVPEHAQLAAVGVAADGKGHAGRDAREDVGLVGHEQHRRVVGHLGQRTGEVVEADEAATVPDALRREGDLIRQACEPERATVLCEPHDVVLVDRYAGGFQRTPAEHRALAADLRLAVVPPIMIAEDGVHAERRLEPRERRRPAFCRHERPHVLVAGLVVAEQQRDVGLQPVGRLDDVGHALEVHPRFAGVEVGDERDAQARAVLPSGRREGVALDAQAERLDAERVANRG